MTRDCDDAFWKSVSGQDCVSSTPALAVAHPHSASCEFTHWSVSTAMALLEDVEDVPMEEQTSLRPNSVEKDASQAANGHDENDKPNDEGGSDDDENEEEYEIEAILDAKRGLLHKVCVTIFFDMAESIYKLELLFPSRDKWPTL